MAKHSVLIYDVSKVLVLVLAVTHALTQDDFIRASNNGDNEPDEENMIGRIQIKKRSVPNEIIPCLTKNDQAQLNSICPTKTKWSSIHCVNDSLGMYTSTQKFVNFGDGYFGVNFNHLFHDPFHLCQSEQRGSKDSDADKRRIEILIKEKTEASENVTILNKLLKELQHEKEALEKELEKTKQDNDEKERKISILSVQVKRWETGHQQCTADISQYKNISSAALVIAQNHIDKLQSENSRIIGLNQQCNNGLHELQKFSKLMQNRNSQIEQQLSNCTISLEACQESEKTLLHRLQEEEKEYDQLRSKCDEDNKRISGDMSSITLELTEYKTKLEGCQHNVHEIRKSRNTCLESLGEVQVKNAHCKTTLNDCANMHNETKDINNICENARKSCAKDAAVAKGELMKCVKDKNLLENELQIAKDEEKHLVKLNSLISKRLGECDHAREELNSIITKLRQQLAGERAAHDDTKAEKNSCLVEATTLKTRIVMYRDQAGNALQKLDDLRHQIRQADHDNFQLDEKLAICNETHNLIQRNHKLCEEKNQNNSQLIDEIRAENKMYHEDLHNVSSLLSIVQNQRDRCLKNYHLDIQAVDEWRSQYELANKRLVSTNLSLVQCKTEKLSALTMFQSLEEEADELHKVNNDLRHRVNKSLHSLSTMAQTISDMQTAMTTKMAENSELSKHLKSCHVSELAANRRYEDCTEMYNTSQSQINILNNDVKRLVSQLGLSRHKAAQLKTGMAHLEQMHKQEVKLHSTTKEHMANLQKQNEHINGLYNGKKTEAFSLYQRLHLCTKNNTETKTDAIQCLENLSECEQDKQKVVESCNTRILDCNTALKNKESDLRNAKEMIATAERTAHGNMQLISNCERDSSSLRNRLEQCIRLTNIDASRINTLQKVNRNVQYQLSVCNNQHSGVRRALEHIEETLRRCREDRELQGQEIHATHGQLVHCHKTCKFTATGCPHAKGETYLPTKSGCMLMSSTQGSHSKLANLCKGFGGHLIDLGVNSTTLKHDVITHLETIGEPPRSVWVENSRKKSEKCFSADLAKINGNPEADLEPEVTPCHTQLPGLCMASAVTNEEITIRTNATVIRTFYERSHEKYTNNILE